MRFLKWTLKCGWANIFGSFYKRKWKYPMWKDSNKRIDSLRLVDLFHVQTLSCFSTCLIIFGATTIASQPNLLHRKWKPSITALGNHICYFNYWCNRHLLFFYYSRNSLLININWNKSAATPADSLLVNINALFVFDRFRIFYIFLF